MSHREPHIQIRDHVLTEAQAMAVRVAVVSFYMETGSAKRALAPMNDVYRARLAEVLKFMSEVSG